MLQYYVKNRPANKFIICACYLGRQEGAFFSLGPILQEAPKEGKKGATTISKRSKHSNSTVMLIQQSERYSVGNKIVLTFNLRHFFQKRYCIIIIMIILKLPNQSHIKPITKGFSPLLKKGPLF